MTIVIDGSNGITGPQSDNDTTINGVTVGKGAGSVATNTAVGVSALAANTTGSNSVGVGYQALNLQTTATGDVAVGAFAGANKATASDVGTSTFVGYSAGRYVTTGVDNTFIGYAGIVTSSGSSNTAVGSAALKSNTTGANNTAVGYQAGYSQTSASNYATYVGSFAGYNTTGTGNTFIGSNAGNGQAAGYLVTTGAKNTILGGYTGNQGGFDMRTSSNYIVLSDGDGNPRGIFNNSGTYMINPGGSSANNPQTLLQFFGGGAATTAGVLRFSDGTLNAGVANSWDIGRDNNSTGNFTFTLNGTQKGYISTSTGAYVPVSDSRAKKNIVNLQYGLKEILALNPVMYNMIEELDTDKKHIGLIAQETKAIMDESVDDIKDESKEFYGLDKSGLVPVLIKAIQELNTLVTAQATEITALKAKVVA